MFVVIKGLVLLDVCMSFGSRYWWE